MFFLPLILLQSPSFQPPPTPISLLPSLRSPSLLFLLLLPSLLLQLCLLFPVRRSSSPPHRYFVSVCFSFFPFQLRSSFKQAFSKKKSPKSASSHSDIEEMTDSSLPASPKLSHNGTAASSLMLRSTHSSSL